jgi:hypothetical protein
MYRDAITPEQLTEPPGNPRIHPVSRADVERLRAVGKSLPKSIQSFYVLWRGNSQQLVAIRHVAAEYAAKGLPNQYTSRT